MHLRHPDGKIKKDFLKELDFIEQRFIKRATWMKENEIETFKFYADKIFPVTLYIQYTYVTWLLFAIVFVGCWYLPPSEPKTRYNSIIKV